MKHKYLWIGITTLLIVLISSSALLRSETALRWALSSAAQVLPGSLNIKSIQGSLLGPIILEGVQYHTQNQAIESERIAIEWQPRALLEAHLHLEKIEVTALAIKTMGGTSATAKSVPLEGFDIPIDIPIAIQLDSLLINDIIYQGADGNRIPITSLSLSAQLDANSINLRHFDIESPQGSLTLSGQINPQDLSFDLYTDWQAMLDEFEPLEGNGTLSGNLTQTSVTQNLLSPVKLTLTGTLFDLLQTPRWQSTVTFERLNPRKIRHDFPEMVIDSVIKGQGDLSQIRLDIGLQTRFEQYGKVDIQTTINGSYTSPWNIEQFLLELPEHNARIQSSGHLAINNATPTYAFDTHWENISWPFNEPPQLTSRNGKARISGTGSDYQLSAEADINTQTIPHGKVTLYGQGNDQMFNFQSVNITTVQGSINTQGDIRWKPIDKETDNQANNQAGNDLSYHFTGQWQNLVWPTMETPTIQSEAGNFQLSGAGVNYQASLKGEIEGQGAPSGILALSGQGNPESFSFQSLSLETLNGVINGQGNIRWQGGLSWEAGLDAHGIDPSAQWPEWEGRLDAKLDSQGSYSNQQLTATIALDRLAGTLRGYPVAGQGKLAINQDQYDISAFSLHMGDATITAQGKLDDHWQMELTAEAPDLAALLPELHGRASATGKISGPRTQARLELKLLANSLSASNLRLDTLSAKMDIDLGDRSPSQIDIQIENARLNDWSVDSARLISDGSVADQRWQLSVAGGEENISLTAQGGYHDNAWQGILHEMRLTTGQAGVWTLESPANLFLSPEKVASSTTCLSSAQGRACLEGNWNRPGTGKIGATFHGLSSALFAPILPEAFEWQDSLSGTVDALIDEQRNIQLNSTVQLGPGSFALTQTVDETLLLEYEKGEISAHTDAGGTQVTLGLVLNKKDQINVEIRFPDYTSLSRITIDEKIEGRMTGTYNGLNLASIFVPALQDLQGLIKLDLNLEGTLGNPLLTGGITLADARATIPEMGIKLSELRLDLITKGSNTLYLQGSARSGSGSVSINGESTLNARQGWPTHIALKGSDLEVARRPGLWIVASPELDITVKDKQINVQGTVAIPRTDIELKGFPEATITSSSDVVIVRGPEAPTVESEKGWTILTEILLLPGDNVRFEGFGLSGRVKGNLTVIKPLDKPFVGTGILEIVEGNYRAFGADLTISQGQLIFTNSPLDNPAIDIRAMRTIPSADTGIVAGLRAQGRLKAATLTLFSEPNMEETDILSYLLLGRPASERSNTDGDLLIAAATAIGTTEAYIATKRLAQSLGFEEARVNRTGLVLGKSLSPRLYLSYEIGLLQPQNTLQLRYRLTDHWTVKVETSEHESTDLIYTIER